MPVAHRVRVRVLPSVRVRLDLRPGRHIERFFNALEYVRRDNQIQAYELLQNEFWAALEELVPTDSTIFRDLRILLEAGKNGGGGLILRVIVRVRVRAR